MCFELSDCTFRARRKRNRLYGGPYAHLALTTPLSSLSPEVFLCHILIVYYKSHRIYNVLVKSVFERVFVRDEVICGYMQGYN